MSSLGARLFSTAFAAALAASATACTIGGPSYVHESMQSSNDSTGSAEQTCSGGFTKPDLSTLTACGDGKAHCYDASKVAMGGLATCDDGKVCVPDKVLEANGGKLQSCNFYINNTPGVCMNIAVPQVDQNKSVLHQEGCDPDERCIPCIRPDTKADTHVCDPQGVHADACTAAAAEPKAAPCCHGSGVCIDSDAAPAGSRDQLHRDACAGDKLCAPAAMVSGTPQKCSALGIDGVCLDLCFASMLEGTGNVIRGDCHATEVCMPCAIGKSQGMPGCD
jgi:hypothetical protein